MMDAFIVAGLVVLYCVMIYILEVKILKIDPYKNPWEGDI